MSSEIEEHASSRADYPCPDDVEVVLDDDTTTAPHLVAESRKQQFYLKDPEVSWSSDDSDEDFETSQAERPAFSTGAAESSSKTQETTARSDGIAIESQDDEVQYSDDSAEGDEQESPGAVNDLGDELQCFDVSEDDEDEEVKFEINNHPEDMEWGVPPSSQGELHVAHPTLLQAQITATFPDLIDKYHIIARLGEGMTL
jgi:hypothetical protein